MTKLKKDKVKNSKFWVIVLFFSFYLVLALVSRLVLKNQKQTSTSSAAGPLTTVTFQPSSDEIANPERGFMRQSNIQLDQPYTSKLGKVNPNDTVNWVYFHMEKYRDPRDGKGVTVSNYQFLPLEPVGSGKGLDIVKKTFDDARTKGLKLVIRFLYLGYGGIGSTQDFANAEPDAPLDVTLKHIDQLAPLIQQNKDVILAVQAGFVGYWGEWHSSKYLSPVANRKAIVDKLLTVVPPDRTIQVRYPKYVQSFYGGPITSSQAFTVSTISRVALHDDAAFKDSTHDGTFTSNAMGMKISSYCDGSANQTLCWQDYYSQTSKYTPAGGEAGTHSSSASPEADCSQAVPMMGKLHFSFLHNGYSMVTLNHWVSQGCMPEIRQRLGYRFALSKLSLSQQVAPGGDLEFHLELENKGFASPYNPRPVVLVLKNTGSSFQKEIPLTSVDVRRWLPGQIVKVDLNIPIPQDVTTGTYNVYLWLPDAGASLKTRPEYAIRMANLNIWQSTSGYNLLFNNLTVSGTPVTPNPTSTSSPTPIRTPTIGGPTPSRTPTPINPTPTSLFPSPTSSRTPTPGNPTPSRTPTPGGAKPGDANGDGKVNSLDLWIWLFHFGQNTNNGARDGDFQPDGKVDVQDFIILLNNYG